MTTTTTIENRIQVLAAQRHQEQITLFEIVSSYVLTSESEFEDAAEILQVAKGRMKEIDAERTALVKPLNDEVKAVNGWFRPALDKLEKIEVMLKRMLADYTVKKRMEQQRLLIAAAEAAAQQKVTDVAPPAMALTLRAAAQAAAPLAVKGISAPEVWRWEVMDEEKIPREFLSVDARKVENAVKSGVREILGVRIFQDVRIIARAK